MASISDDGRSLPGPSADAPEVPAAAPSHRRWAIAIALMIAAGASAAIALRPGPEVARELATARAVRGEIERLVLAVGTIEPHDEVEVRPRLSGIVEEVLVEEGDLVEKGSPLIRLDRDLIGVQVEEAAAVVAAAEAELDQAKFNHYRVEALFQQAVLSESNRKQADTALRGAVASLSRARAQLLYLKKQLGYATIEAPFAGRILQLHVKPGSAVSSITSVTAGTPLLRIADTGRLLFDGLVDETDVGFIAVGQSVRIVAEAYSDRFFAGTLTEITPAGERHENVTYFRVEAEIDDPGAHLLRPKMTTEGQIVAETIADVILIPETALRYEGNDIFVDLVKRPAGGDVSLERRRIEVGVIEQGRAQVLSGLRHSDEVRIQ